MHGLARFLKKYFNIIKHKDIIKEETENIMSFLLRIFTGFKEARSQSDQVSAEDFAQNVQLICSTEFFVPCLQSKKKQSKKAEKSVLVDEKVSVQNSVDTEEKPLKRLFPWLF
jgi:hypothetical protein